MPKPRLNYMLLEKIAEKRGKDRKYIKNIRVMVSKLAAKIGISSEAALVLLAKKHGIGAANYQRKLDYSKQSEVREALPIIFQYKHPEKLKIKTALKKKPLSSREILKSAIEYLIIDTELKDRCTDLLLAPSNFDRAINQATQILENRIRIKAKPSNQLVGVNLINYAFKNDLSKTILKVGNNSDEQNGVANILRGIMLSFRNPTHHHISDAFTREDSLRICGFIDVLLKIVDSSIKIK